MLPLSENPGLVSGHGHVPPWSWSFTENGRITLFFIFGPTHFFLNFQIFLDMF